MNKNLSYEVSHVVVTPRLIELLKQKPKGRYTRLEAYFDLLSRAMVKKPFTVLPKTAAAELLGEFDTTGLNWLRNGAGNELLYVTS